VASVGIQIELVKYGGGIGSEGLVFLGDVMLVSAKGSGFVTGG